MWNLAQEKLSEFEIHDLKWDCSVLEARAQSLSEQLRDLTAEHSPNTEDSCPHKIPATCQEMSGVLPFGYSPPAASMPLSEQPLLLWTVLQKWGSILVGA